ncbi:MAG: hypothetical protein FJ118_17025 [Deltaproteobacteria bacterium]|nr:hypothetical protein [Deltaproteobacteria bacterium]
MNLLKRSVAEYKLLGLLIILTAFGFCGVSLANPLSDAQIAAELKKDANKVIIGAFLKHELGEVNQYATKPLLKQHPSLIFFIKQVERNPLESLFFLEDQVHKLRDAQENIGSLPYSLAFSASEKEKILGLKDVAKRIISYGLPLMKRDFYRVIEACKALADKKGKHPMELIADPAFRDAVYRHCESAAAGLDREMGELSQGEQISMKLGWTLEQVTITRLWLVFNDNTLPRPEDYTVYRKKRSEYWQKRLARIYGKSETSASANAPGRAR